MEILVSEMTEVLFELVEQHINYLPIEYLKSIGYPCQE